MSTAERADALARHVIAPLVLGGPVLPDRPFGPRLALEIGVHQRMTDPQLAAEIDVLRRRCARTLAPVDVLPELHPSEWTIAAAFNDLLQVTNHQLSSFATRGRHLGLLASVVDLCGRVPLSATLEEALCRHATFSRALEVSRTDTRVSWWTGSASFRGQAPPNRLLAWPSMRRVQIDKRRVPLVDMAEGVPLETSAWHEGLGRWLSLSPLSDLAQCGRAQPTFAWSRHSLSVIATVAGRNLTLRAISVATGLERGATSRAIEALTAATAELVQGSDLQSLAIHFVEELRAAVLSWSAEVA